MNAPSSVSSAVDGGAGAPSGVTVRHHRAPGAERLDVFSSDGSVLGWYSLTTNTAHSAAPEFLPSVLVATADWLRRPPARGRHARRDEPYAPAAAPGTARTPPGAQGLYGGVRSGAGLPRSRTVPLPAPPAPPPPVRAAPARTGRPGARVDPGRPRPPEPSPPPLPPGAEDLVGRVPGLKLLEKADSLRPEAPRRRLLAPRGGRHDGGTSWRAGAAGEEAVARRLGMLRAVDYRWGYLNSVPVGTREADIDHVVMGPGGVFSINAKHHRDASLWVAGSTFMVNGLKYPYVRNSLHEARRASRLLSRACGFRVHVTPLIVPVGHRKLTIREEPDGVCVVGVGNLGTWLGAHPDVVPPEQLRIVLERARISTTWTR